MPLSLNEIRERARAFAREWATETSERAEAQSFWNEFFAVFGKKRRSVAVFEQKAQRFNGSKHGRIDVFWPGILLAEHKSAGVDLDAAYEQATDYFAGLSEGETPQYILVSDFQRFRLYDLDADAKPVEFPLTDLPKEIGRFGFISGYQTRSYKEEDPVNVQAAERMGRLHDALKAAGFDGHALELLLVRLLFCLFADDTGIFPRQSFHELISQRTREDGSDLGMWVGRIFQVLNTAPDKRQTTLDEQLAELPYVNGKLFDELIPLADFNAHMRGLLLDASALDWSRISPAIFGSMFQSVMDAKARRNLGAHYTSEKNILKLIGPLFLDGLKEALHKAGTDEKKLAQLHRTLATLKFLDPACGCGNFLVIAYRELRLLELEVLKRQFARQQSVLAHVQDHVLLDVDQFYGIEIEEFPAQIAQVAMWLMDHQMNLRVSEQFGENVVRLPLRKSATIVHGNALRLDWNDVVPAAQLGFMLGNPPFGGKHYQSQEQRADQMVVTAEIRSGSDLDFVANWFIKAASYTENTHVDFAFVATNSITQGEQVPLLWPCLLDRFGMRVHFAHRTFRWRNEARGQAAVHCVIIGMTRDASSECRLFEYESPGSEPQELRTSQINPYLADGPGIAVSKRSSPLDQRPTMRCGSKPTDDGSLILNDEDRVALIAEFPITEQWIRPFIGADEFLNGGWRWCLWLVDVLPSELRGVKPVLERIAAVRRFREKSTAAPTRAAAERPSQFFFISQPQTEYILVPEVSSERRRYVPIGWMSPNVVSSNKNYLIAEPSLYIFGLLQSSMHMAWLATVAGRLKSDYQYSASMVYNNFPWPELSRAPAPSPAPAGHPLPEGEGKHKAAIETAAQAVLNARAQFPDATLADLYDPLTMPPALVKAHAALDKAVDAAYTAAEKSAGRKPPKLTTDAERVAFLFERYQALTSLLPVTKAKAVRKRKEASA